MRYLFLVFIVASIFGCAQSKNQNKEAFVSSDVTGTEVKGDFQLVDGNGKQRKLSDFKGKVVALFFGYTHCPDVCPTTLGTLSKAKKMLGTDQLQVVFVTLDPERDSAEKLGKYVQYFDQTFVGLRGNVETTKKMAESFKIFYEKQASSDKNEYTLDHSAGIYAIDKKGRVRLFMNQGLSDQDFAHDFGLLISE